MTRDTEEIWENLESYGYPDYSVSNWGRVANEKTGRPMALSRNQQDYVKVSLVNNRGDRRTAQVNHLVASVFLQPPPSAAFDTLIHLDGNKDHTFATNLAWRPRWFALQYHKQFIDRAPFVPEPVWDGETREQFFDSRHAAKKFGLLEKDIFRSTCTGIRVFPTGQTFRIGQIE